MLSVVQHREIFDIFQKYFMKYFRTKKFMKFYITTCRSAVRTWAAVALAVAETVRVSEAAATGAASAALIHRRPLLVEYTDC